MEIGYARVSTKAQDTAAQLSALRHAGILQIVEEKRSGVAARPQLETLLEALRPGQTLVVFKVDRLARSLVDLLRIIERVKRAGASFRSLTEPIDTRTPAGMMVVQMLGVIAQFERAVIAERCNAGRAEAHARGVRFGRRPKVEAAQVLALRQQGLSWSAVARKLGVTRRTAIRAASGVRVTDGGPGEHAFRARNSPPE